MLRYIFPIGYLLTACYLVFGPPGEAGHGYGVELAYRLALPASLLLPDTGGFYILLFLGLCEYALIGFTLDRAMSAWSGKRGSRHG